MRKETGIILLGGATILSLLFALLWGKAFIFPGIAGATILTLISLKQS